MNLRSVKLLTDPTLKEMQLVLDIEMKNRAKKGIGAEKRTASSISVDEEDLFWEKGLLGSKTPSEHVFTLAYLFGIEFALRGRKELRAVTFGQITECTEEDGFKYLQYRENAAKNNQGGLKSRGQIKLKAPRACQMPDLKIQIGASSDCTDFM